MGVVWKLQCTNTMRVLKSLCIAMAQAVPTRTIASRLPKTIASRCQVSVMDVAAAIVWQYHAMTLRTVTPYSCRRMIYSGAQAQTDLPPKVRTVASRYQRLVLTGDTQ